MFSCHIHAPQTQIWKANDWLEGEGGRGWMLDEVNWEGASDQSISALRFPSESVRGTDNNEIEFKQLMHELTVVYISLCLLTLIEKIKSPNKIY